jgi:hypothetical protein
MSTVSLSQGFQAGLSLHNGEMPARLLPKLNRAQLKRRVVNGRSYVRFSSFIEDRSHNLFFSSKFFTRSILRLGRCLVLLPTM